MGRGGGIEKGVRVKRERRVQVHANGDHHSSSVTVKTLNVSVARKWLGADRDLHPRTAHGPCGHDRTAPPRTDAPRCSCPCRALRNRRAVLNTPLRRNRSAFNAAEHRILIQEAWPRRQRVVRGVAVAKQLVSSSAGRAGAGPDSAGPQQLLMNNLDGFWPKVFWRSFLQDVSFNLELRWVGRDGPRPRGKAL